MELFSFEGASADRIYEAFADNLMNCDFLTPMGFLQVVAGVMRLHRGGILLAAIPCNSRVFLSRWTTGRGLDILGNTGNALVASQNALVARMVYILILCIKRGVLWMIEQPWSSIVFEHPRWQYLERRFGHLSHYVECDMGIYTLDLVKKSVLVGTAPYLSNLGKVLTPAGRRTVFENPKKKDNCHQVY